ncbi:armadillo-type protein [Achaetomium macrosporum]|uniref:Armadillo-type protein n=1 Tax=Achaetomium macrosporum TaxID=79813 RepID=A0AAN7C9M8_9PEZI|nr:armadillo-type protein [Achaetomium macrosporum]
MATVPGIGAFGTAAAGDGGEDILLQIHEALKVVHSPYSTNQARQEAQAFLESVKTLGQAPSHGFNLAFRRPQDPIVRHYGLSLLEHAVKHKWEEYSPEHREYLRTWVLQLAETISAEDPGYLRNKIAQLWVEVAKRSWAASWMDMDYLLVRLWQVSNSPVHKQFVLQILEALSDEIFNGDDAVVALREGALSKACVEIFTPAAILTETFPNRQAGPDVRFESEGWLNRITQLISECLRSGLEQNEDVGACVIKALNVLNSVVPWAIPKALHAVGCREAMCSGLAAPSVPVQKAALESLYSLYSRPNFSEEEFVDLAVPMYSEAMVDLFRRLLEWSAVDAQDIDDDKYQFAKKFSEMLCALGNLLDRKFGAIPPHTNIRGFLELLMLVVQSQSLVVSIPILLTWTRILTHGALGPAAADMPFIVDILELCSNRLIRYESFPEDTEDPVYLLLIEDTDTIPERHAFLGNYRRYCCSVIESIVNLKMSEAFSHILSRAENAFRTLYEGQPPLNPANYSKNSLPVLTVDAHATVIEAALKGYDRWRTTRNRSPEEKQQAAAVEEYFEKWCGQLLEMNFEDPLIRKRILQLLVNFSTKALDSNPAFMLRVLEYILMTWPALQPEHRLFNDAIRDLQTESMVELQRLASKMPDPLLDVYDQLEAKVQELIASGTLDEKRQVAYQSFLFIIIHRATRIDQTTRLSRLTAFIEPVKNQWKDESLKQALGSYNGFCELLGLDNAQKYLARRRVHEIADWGSTNLDSEGLVLQAELEQRQALLPLRVTKSFLTYSVERIERNSPPYQASCTLWQDGFRLILPELLKFLSYAHASHNPANWSLLPAEMQPVVGRLLSDRFWQAGISEGSKDDFYARVLGKKNTLEGLASTIRGAVRFVRETCYAIIYCMTRLDMQFYGFLELPGPLANALFADSFYLSSHQVINLLTLVRFLVDNCPVELRDHFVPPILATCFEQMDTKISSEWEKLGQLGAVPAAGEELTEEMKAESILRQLTYSAVLMVADVLDPARVASPTTSPDKPEDGVASNTKYPPLRKFCLMNPAIAVPLLVFCSHAIRMRDGRCCGVVLRVFRSIVPEFRPSEVPNAHKESGHTAPLEDFPIPEDTARDIREFISTEVLRAAISSLHDPYFVDSQKDLGALIASILASYSHLTPTPRNILVSLPNIKPEDVDNTIQQVSKPGIHSRQQRALVLELLEDLKGVSISEMGKLTKSLGARPGSSHGGKKSTRSKMVQAFMTPNAGSATGRAAGAGDPTTRNKSPDFEGVAGMFNEAS